MTTAEKTARKKQAVPTTNPLEAGDLACSTCGKILKAKVKMGPSWVDYVYYECRNEEYGCNYRVERKVPIQFATPQGIRADGTAIDPPR